jgi:hypothetical protein
VPRTLWRKGQRVTSVDLLPGRDGATGEEARSTVIVAAGAVVGVRVLPILPQKVFDGIVVAIAVLASVRLIVQWP